ncbi:hypothetical protein, partial [Fulvivirga aurantia]|uniref:hypothetical protein n=1 Tax=Fulvivirga aurantia TaxID=2529383 RepID=UPI00162ACE52
SSGFAQKFNSNWEADLKSVLTEFEKCKDACFEAQGLALNKVYNIDDFYSEKNKRYFTTNEMADYLKENGNWTNLGPAYDTKALVKAQELANQKKATIAIYMGDDGLGHMALIVPGSLSPSGSWQRQVPNSVSFLSSDPSKSYIGKGLSYAFTKNMLKHVVIYARNY